MSSTACTLHCPLSAIEKLKIETYNNMECGLLPPAFRANPCPEDTNLLCRLPLPAVFYKPGAANLGDLLRIPVRERVLKFMFSDFQG